jgi:hypothetical protein
MSLDETEVVDAIGLEKETSIIVLTISDAWRWDDSQSHLDALEKKINAYFAFIENGQILESYPHAHGKKLVIDVVGRFPLPTVGIEKISDLAKQLNINIRHRHYPTDGL